MASNSEVKEEYASSLRDLTFNSKPLISVLTILAEENIQHAKDIVGVIENHLTRVRTEVKLPVLYLIDCIIKNVGREYTSLFCQNIVSTFCSVFEQVDEKTRSEMFKLRQTWNDILPQKKLYALDVQIQQLDPAWPVTAPPPNNSIHLNPKFLKNNPAAVSKTNTVKVATSAPGVPPSVDPETLSMQQKLINKQKELLELQQRKLELELLQTQVRLQEQLKSKSSSDTKNNAASTAKVAVNSSQNLLLKPGVAKELMGNTKVNTKNKINVQSNSGSRIRGVPQQQNASGQTISSRVSSVNVQRPVRDPRLQKRKEDNSVQENSTPNENLSSNVHLESKTKSASPQIIHSENKVVTNKISVGESRSEPRSVNKNKGFGQGKNKTSPSSSSPSPKSKKTSKLNPLNSKSDIISSNSNFSLSKNQFPNKMVTKIKKKSVTLGKDSLDQQGRDISPPSSREHDVSSGVSEISNVIIDKKSDKPAGLAKSVKMKSFKSDSNTAIKELKMSVKNRNYIRRNRETSISPEPPHDVDLRLTIPPEKLPKLHEDTADTKRENVDNLSMDVDLRQLPSIAGKKRTSVESLESSPNKKTKSAMFDVLFGSEDTDLRQLPQTIVSPKIAERPKTPPPPIISEKTDTSIKLKSNKGDKDSPKKKHLDLLRAKLANATSRDKIENVTSSKVEKEPLNLQEDTDMRKLNSVDRIYISPADEQSIKAGNMTKAQEAALMSKIIAQIESQKLREAKRKECEVLQPISDDELEVDAEFSGSDVEEVTDITKNDQDDRISPVPTSYNRPNEHILKKPRIMESRRPVWRGRRGREAYFGAMGPFRPIFRGRQDPWGRIPPHGGPWRSMMNSGYIKSHFGSETSGMDGSDSPTFDGPGHIVFSESSEDGVKTINIDGIPRVIRVYDETAVIFMNWDDPREISFQAGSRRITFDDNESYVLSFGEPYRDVLISGSPHKIRFGAPTKEVYIDSKGYECYFGTPGVTIDIDGKIVRVKLDGPPPQVKIGTTKRVDLVAGKINLIIDAKIIIPIYLDGKQQQFEIDGKVHKLKFINSLKKVFIDDVVYPTEFGGLPKAITLSSMKHFIRFSVLPKGIRPGQVNIKNMESIDIHDSSSNVDNENSLDSFPNVLMQNTDPALPLSDRRNVINIEDEADKNSNDQVFLQNIINNQNFSNLDLLSNVMTSTMPTASNVSNYQVENNEDVQITSDETKTAVFVEEKQKPPMLPPSININELFQKLVATGIVTTATGALSTTIQSETTSIPSIKTTTAKLPLPVANKNQKFLSSSKPVYFDKPETLKMRQFTLVQALYIGMQCSSCGMRFPPELSMQYSQHLDWHFRQNRKGKKNIRKASSRRWYYSTSDWKNYEEIEDIEEREKSYFENQTQEENNANDEEEDIEIPSVAADQNEQDACCRVCKEKFEQFYNEEKEEWHLRMAVRVDGVTYHPLCHEDYLNSLANESILDDSKLSDSHVEEVKENIPGLEESKKVEVPEDDDELEIIEENNDVKMENDAQEAVETEKDEIENDEADADADIDDDDVIINEVIPEKIVVDDDDDDVQTEIVVEKIKPVEIKQPIDDDGFIDVENGLLQLKTRGEVKIKSEPLDPDEILEEETEENTNSANSNNEFKPSIDGNVEYNSSKIPITTASVGGKIKINISKPILSTTVSSASKESSELKDGEECVETVVSNHDVVIDPSQPLPPGEEPVQLNIKPSLVGVHLKKLPPVRKGTELTGLCSIM